MNIIPTVYATEGCKSQSKMKIPNSQPRNLCTWNVNGLAARFKDTKNWQLFDHLVRHTDQDSDIIALQEVHVKRDPLDPAKPHTEDVDWIVTLESYFPEFLWFKSFSRKRYAGQVVGVRKDREIPAVTYDLGPELFDEAENHEADGRIIILEFSRVIITCLYVPSSTMNNAVNIEYRRKFDVKLADFLREKIKVSNKYLILMGDLNVAKDLKYTTNTFAEWHEHFITRYPKSTLETAQMNRAIPYSNIRTH